jgi:hypothetical protein
MSEEPHHRPRRGHRNLAQGRGSPATGLRRWGEGRGPQRQVFVAGVEAGAPCDRSSSLGWRTSAHQRTQSWVSCKICLEPRRGGARESTAVNSDSSAMRPRSPPATIILYVPSKKLAFEIDGESHKLQSRYDAGRDAWLLDLYGVRTTRITNRDAFTGNVEQILRLC